MMSKKKAIVYGVILVVVTALFTSTLQIAIGNKVVVSKDIYESLKKYNKMLALESIIDDDFYQKPSEANLVNVSPSSTATTVAEVV